MMKITSKNHLFFQLILSLALTSMMGHCAYAATRSFTGCEEGQVYTDDEYYPQGAYGAVPDRIANYEMAFQKGHYLIRISSRFEFIPFIYKMINGEYRWAGLPTRVNMQNDRSGNAFFYYDFSANHLTDGLQNFWLLQIKPVPEAQTVPHTIRVITKVVDCPKTRTDTYAMPCPYGMCGEASTFGTTSGCRKSPGCSGAMCGTPGCP